MIPQDIIKQANALRTRLQKGSLNVYELEQFLAKVEGYGAPPAGHPKAKDRFLQQLENLERGYSRKPKV
jgi:hypothetical protein